MALKLFKTLTFLKRLSEFHKMTVQYLDSVSVMKYSGQVSDAKLSKYDIYNTECHQFLNIFTDFLTKQGTTKNNCTGANQSDFICKNFRKSIMKRSSLCIIFLKEKTEKKLLHKSPWENKKRFCLSEYQQNN